MDELNKEKCLIDWIDFIEYTIEKNWKVTQTISKIEESLVDVFGKEYSDEVIKRLRYYLIQKYKDLSC